MIDSAIQINGLALKNRLFKPAMSEQLADRNNNPKPELLANLYRQWSLGGAGLLISGNIMIDRQALGEPMNVVLDDHSDLSAFKTWVSGAKSAGSAFFAQLNHPGKQIPKFLDSEPMAPSAIPMEGPLASNFKCPREMSSADINRVITQFARSAELAKEVGFDGVEIHGAHGYLINQFLSPRHNQRSDEWRDGNLFLLSVYRAVRDVVGENFPIIIKLNSSDFEAGGYSESEAIAVMKLLTSEGIDAIEISGGTYEAQAMTGDGQDAKKGGYFLNFARSARDEISVPLMITGGFQSREHVNQALGDGIDMVGMGRTMILEPNLVNQLLDQSSAVYQNDMRRGRWHYLNVVTMLSWWELQMLRVAQGKRPNPRLHVFFAAVHALFHVGVRAFAPRRG